jgi:hypothetical protein
MDVLDILGQSLPNVQKNHRIMLCHIKYLSTLFQSKLNRLTEMEL